MIELLHLLSPNLFSLALTLAYVLCHAAVKKTAPPIGRTVLVATFLTYVFALLSVTLLFRSAAYSNIELDPIASYRRAMRAPAHLAAIEIRNIILNIAMFVPLGVFLPLLFKKCRKFYVVLSASFLTTLAIEATQLATRRGVFAIEDILHNTLGAALGFALFFAFLKIRSSEK